MKKTKASEYLSSCLYNELGVNADADGWFKVDEILAFVSYNVPLDLQGLEDIVKKEKGRYILSDDKTLLRISPDHIAPPEVEPQLKKAGKLRIKDKDFTKNSLAFHKDDALCIRVECSDGGKWQFPYETNKIFCIDDKRFFFLGELPGQRILSVSSFMRKNVAYRYRMLFVDIPGVINNIYPLDALLQDYENKTYKFEVAEVQC